jgi:hypothetical protein
MVISLLIYVSDVAMGRDLMALASSKKATEYVKSVRTVN